MKKQTAMNRDWIATARTLSQALPYLQRYTDAIVVIKLGGHAMGSDEAMEEFARDVVLMQWSESELPSYNHARRASLIFLAVVGVAATGVLPIVAAAVAMCRTKCRRLIPRGVGSIIASLVLSSYMSVVLSSGPVWCARKPGSAPGGPPLPPSG